MEPLPYTERDREYQDLHSLPASPHAEARAATPGEGPGALMPSPCPVPLAAESPDARTALFPAPAGSPGCPAQAARASASTRTGSAAVRPAHVGGSGVTGPGPGLSGLRSKPEAQEQRRWVVRGGADDGAIGGPRPGHGGGRGAPLRPCATALAAAAAPPGA